MIHGCDIAGQIEAAGQNVKRFKVGDAVFGDLSESGWGAFAEYACARENSLILRIISELVVVKAGKVQ
jgi:NADPH:quinone reductase-like Zn-dependent oxidoreductase